MRKIYLVLSFISLLGLILLYYLQIPMYIEFILGYYFPLAFATLINLVSFIFNFKNKVIFTIVLLISLIAPGFYVIENSNSSPEFYLTPTTLTK